MDFPLASYVDAYDLSSGLTGFIDVHLHNRGMQLEPSSSEKLRHILQELLQLVEVQFLDDEGNLESANKQYEEFRQVELEDETN